MEAIDLIYQLENECKHLSNDIITRMCKRIIRILNKTMTNLDGDDYDALGMSYVDKISIKYQTSFSLEEIGRCFDDGIKEMIDTEYNLLDPKEKFILNYSECTDDGSEFDNFECDTEKVKGNILSELCKIFDQHYYTNRVQKYVEKYDLL